MPTKPIPHNKLNEGARITVNLTMDEVKYRDVNAYKIRNRLLSVKFLSVKYNPIKMKNMPNP